MWQNDLVSSVFINWPTWIELTTPLAMTESFPATERTPSLSCDMSGALGSTLVRRYELAAWTRANVKSQDQLILTDLSLSGTRDQLKTIKDVSCVFFAICWGSTFCFLFLIYDQLQHLRCSQESLTVSEHSV